MMRVYVLFHQVVHDVSRFSGGEKADGRAIAEEA